MPDLGTALRSLAMGDCLTVPHFGHIVTADVWREVAEWLVKQGATIESIVDRVTLDGTDTAAGMALLKRQSGRALTDARARAGLKTGRPKQTLTGKKLAEALRLFPDPEWSAERLAAHLGYDRMTFLRRMQEITGTMSKGEALELLKAGGWPPKRKITR